MKKPKVNRPYQPTHLWWGPTGLFWRHRGQVKVLIVILAGIAVYVACVALGAPL